ncbi:MAG: permease, partial [Dermatophilaceae bacterium]
VVLRTLAPALLGALLGAIAGQWLTTTWHVQPTLAFAAATAVLATLTAAVSAVLPAAFAAQRDPVAVLRTP